MITFAQAEGLTPLPSQLALKTITKEMRAKLWNVLYTYLKSCESTTSYNVHDPMISIVQEWHVNHEFLPIDEINNDVRVITENLKSIIYHRDYSKVLTFLEVLIRHPKNRPAWTEQFKLALRSARAAYTIVDNTIVPVASDEEAVAIERTFRALAGGKFAGARAHLRSASTALTQGAPADAIRESIHAVESVARVIAPGQGTLGAALTEVAKLHPIHPALKAGFSSLYGYTSDAQGVRHALVDAPVAEVDEADALYMFGACASFITYLIAKAVPDRK
jgi:hypothetical protein